MEPMGLEMGSTIGAGARDRTGARAGRRSHAAATPW